MLEGHDHVFRRNAISYMEARRDEFETDGAEVESQTVPEQRIAAFRRAQLFVQSGLVSVRDITGDPLKFLAAHEVLTTSEASTIYLFSVHFNLFGGSVLKLGTERHHAELLEGIDSMETPGCFALTEMGHGVISGMFMDTTATFDHKTDTFVIHTPNEGAKKNWISNAANNAVFAGEALILCYADTNTMATTTMLCGLERSET